VITRIVHQLQKDDQELVKTLLDMESSEHTYDTILSFPGFGPFLAYQVAVDIGYIHPILYNSTQHVVAGEGDREEKEVFFFCLLGVRSWVYYRVEVDFSVHNK